ncbi:MAG: HEAT repeat domain-containing protein [Planctomycetes bacterium]|nr:HEAT repeat domain-containing protein [Planctomycetota bacterium]
MSLAELEKGALPTGASRPALPDLERRSAALLCVSFSMLTLAYLAARTARDAVFLSILPSSELPSVFAWSALAMALGLFVVIRLGRRGRPEAQFAIGAAGLGSLLFAARLGLSLGGGEEFVRGLYVLVEAGSAVVALLFWLLVEGASRAARTAARLRELARGVVTMLALAGSAWALLLLLAVPPRDLLFFAACLLWLSSLPAILLSAGARRHRPTSNGSPFAGILTVIGAADLRLAAVVTTVATFVAVLVDFQFKDVIAARNPGDPVGIARATAGVFAVAGLASLAIGRSAPLLRHRLGAMATVICGLGLALLGQCLLFVAPVLWTVAIARAPLETLRPSAVDSTLDLVLQPVPRRLREHWTALVEVLLRPAALALGALALMVISVAPRDVMVTVIAGLVLLHFLMLGLRREHARSLGLARRHWPQPGEVLRRLLGDAGGASTVMRALHEADPTRVREALELAQLVSRDLSRLVVPLLGHDDPAVRRLSCDYLAERPKTDPELLRPSLSDDDPRARASAVRAFCRLGGVVALDEMAPLLDHEDPYLASAAAAALARQPGTAGEGVAALRRVVSSGDPNARRRAAQAMGELGNRVLADSVGALLEDEDLDVRREAIEAAGLLREPAHLLPLLWALRSRETARGAEVALSAFGAGVLEQALERHGSDPVIAGGVLRALGRVASPEALELLTSLLWAESDVMRADAAAALAKAVQATPRLELDRPRLHTAMWLELAAAYRALAAAEALELPDLPAEGASGCAPVLGATPPWDPRERAELLVSWALDEEFERAAERVFLVLAALHPDSVGKTLAIRRSLVIAALSNRLAPDLARALLGLYGAQPRSEKLRGATGVLLPPERAPEEWLFELLGAEAAWTLTAATSWAGAHRVSSAIPRITGHLQRPEPYLREAALEALEQLLPVDQLPRVIRPLLWDEVPAIRERVDELLERIVDEAELRHATGELERVVVC